MILTRFPPNDIDQIPSIPVREPAGKPPADQPRPSRAIASAPTFPNSFRLLDDEELMDVPDPDWIVEGVIPRGGRVIIYGPSGSYKTTLVAHLFVAIATGQSWFGRKIIHRGASIYVACEDVSGFKIRLAAAKRAARLPLGSPCGVYTFPDAIDLRDAANVAQFVAFIKSTGLRFEIVAIDTYAAATPGSNENSSEDVTIALAHALQIANALNTTVVLIHHSNAAGTRERGHSALRGSADTMISMVPADDVVSVQCSKQKNGPPFVSFDIRLVPLAAGGCTLKFAADVPPDATLSPAQHSALTALRDVFSAEGATTTEWQRTCKDFSERTFFRARTVLVERKYVIEGSRAGGRYRITPEGEEALNR